jgi:hypothetical protein
MKDVNCRDNLSSIYKHRLNSEKHFKLISIFVKEASLSYNMILSLTLEVEKNFITRFKSTILEEKDTKLNP